MAWLFEVSAPAAIQSCTGDWIKGDVKGGMLAQCQPAEILGDAFLAGQAAQSVANSKRVP
jgi:hypothetical protein